MSREQAVRPGHGRKTLAHAGHVPTGRDAVLKEETFHAMLTLERRRAERSRKPFVLMLLDSHLIRENGSSCWLRRVACLRPSARRPEKPTWWLVRGRECSGGDLHGDQSGGKNPITEVLHSKVVKALRDHLDHKLASKLAITVHLFPESWDKDRPDRVADIKLYPDLSEKDFEEAHSRSR